MPNGLARRKLASRAAHLNARSPHAGRVPSLVLMTDDDRMADPLAAARLLPRGAMVVVRSRDAARRMKLAFSLMAIARMRALIVLIANDARLAQHSAAAHDVRAATTCKSVDALFLSPIFPTLSHPQTNALTPVRANRMAQALRLPVYALGGVTFRNAGLLHGFSGIAAISALSDHS